VKKLSICQWIGAYECPCDQVFSIFSLFISGNFRDAHAGGKHELSVRGRGMEMQNNTVSCIVEMYTWCFSVAKLLVCIGDCGMTPFDGGIPIRPHRMTCHKIFNIYQFHTSVI
jgi:hypothetical protein